MRKLVVIAVIAIAWWILRSPVPHVAEQGVPQTMVLVDGFAVVDGPETARVMIALDRDGTKRSQVELPPLAPEIRVVGTGAGPAAAWLAKDKLVVRMLDSGDSFQFGKRAKRLCEGTASNEVRFGIAWLESDGRVWMVHGPVASDVAASDDDAPKPSWCGIASAGDDIALVWADGNKVYVNLCDKRRCSGNVAKLALDPDWVRGFGCARDGCMFATKDGKLTAFTAKGSKRWTRDVPGIRAGDRVSIVGGGDRYAVGYHRADGGAAIARVGAAGTVAELWRDPRADQAPSLALAGDRLVASYHRDRDLQHLVIKLL